MTHPSSVGVSLHHFVMQNRAWSSVEMVVEGVTGPAAIADRLKAWGFCPGRRITIIRHGDPAIIEILGTRIGLSAAIAQCVAVRPVEDRLVGTIPSAHLRAGFRPGFASAASSPISSVH